MINIKEVTEVNGCNYYYYFTNEKKMEKPRTTRLRDEFKSTN